MHHTGAAGRRSPGHDDATASAVLRACLAATVAVLLVVVTVMGFSRPAAAEGDYCAALPPEAGILEEDPGVRCLGQLPNAGFEPIIVEIEEVAPPTTADERARALVDDLAASGNCSPYELTDGTLTEAFDCVTALSVLEVGPVVISATLTVPEGTLDGQPFWSQTTSAVRLIGNRLGLAETGAAEQDTDEDDAAPTAPADGDADGDTDDEGSLNPGVAAGVGGAVVITGVIVGRTVQRRRRRGRPGDATPDPCAELGALGDAINRDFLALEPLRAELVDVWDRWHELLWDEADLVAEINRVQEDLGWWGRENTGATVLGGVADVGATVVDAVGDEVVDGAGRVLVERSSVVSRMTGPGVYGTTGTAINRLSRPEVRWGDAAVGTALAGVAAGAAVYGEHVESNRQAAVERLGALRAQLDVLQSRKADLASEAQGLRDEFGRRVDELRQRAIDYRDSHRAHGCDVPPIYLDQLDRNWFDTYRPPRPPVAEPTPDRPRPAEVDCQGFTDALANYTRERNRVQAALDSSDGDEATTLAARLLVLDKFDLRVAAYRGEIERTVADVRLSRARWSSHSLSLGLVAALPVAAGLSFGAGLLVVVAGCVASYQADQISPTDADLLLVGRLRQIESHIAEVRHHIRARQVQLVTTRDTSLGALEDEHARLRRAAARCGTEATIPEPPQVSAPPGVTEAARASELIRNVTAQASGVATNGDLDHAVWIDLMLKETSRW